MNMSDSRVNKCMWGYILTLFLAALVGLGRAADDKGYPNYKGPVAPFMQVISTNAVCVLPDRTHMSAAAFVAGTAYAQGATVSSAGQWYMCVIAAGTSGTNRPHHTSGDVSDGTNTWRYFPSGSRKGWVISNVGTNELKLGYGYRPTATTGASLQAGGESSPVSDALQGAVYLIGVGVTNGLVTGIEL